jgi:hypothetical protein
MTEQEINRLIRDEIKQGTCYFCGGHLAVDLGADGDLWVYCQCTGYEDPSAGDHALQGDEFYADLMELAVRQADDEHWATMNG